MSGRRGGLSRRAALCAGGVLVAGCVRRFAVEQVGVSEITFGLVADVQYADRDGSLGRFYRDSAEKLRECIRAPAPTKRTAAATTRTRDGFCGDWRSIIASPETPHGSTE